ncbi:hypothetical protein [Citrobacter freundii]|uniref:hypothetical protein n=1 Tax=Citrobacter freundii TaxID=546 RepID=UPI00164F3814|nr:hypothetical protein [Citrobacter braakii]HCK0217620.1 hypothetical protein [Citrobacter freundii]HDT4645614.1 hypothetical protein [Citrobacter freundii]HEB0900685.1 hypothetical protein [Citrobacter freundii]HEB0905405.1 hypothetical protein [Citrobacter freundii]
MPCIKCGKNETIKAHLIPKVFCKEIQVGKMHAAGVINSNKFTPTQSGIFDKHILCAKCDGELGELENYAAKTFRIIRKNYINDDDGIKKIPSRNPELIYRFAAGILWKYSIAEESLGRIDLEGFGEDIKKYAFGEITRPSFFDGLFTWLRIYKGVPDLFAYRAPFPIELDGVNAFRFLLGGMLFIIKVDVNPFKVSPLSGTFFSNSSELNFSIAPAQYFEEFKDARKLAFENGRLGNFLDKHGV